MANIAPLAENGVTFTVTKIAYEARVELEIGDGLASEMRIESEPYGDYYSATFRIVDGPAEREPKTEIIDGVMCRILDSPAPRDILLAQGETFETIGAAARWLAAMKVSRVAFACLDWLRTSTGLACARTANGFEASVWPYKKDLYAWRVEGPRYAPPREAASQAAAMTAAAAAIRRLSETGEGLLK